MSTTVHPRLMLLTSHLCLVSLSTEAPERSAVRQTAFTDPKTVCMGFSLIVWANGSSNSAKSSRVIEYHIAGEMFCKVLIIDMKFLSSPKSSKTTHKYSKPTLSKGFYPSKLSTAAGCPSSTLYKSCLVMMYKLTQIWLQSFN